MHVLALARLLWVSMGCATVTFVPYGGVMRLVRGQMFDRQTDTSTDVCVGNDIVIVIVQFMQQH